MQRLGSLVFMRITSSDSGNYTCEAVNEELDVGETRSLHRVQVNTSGPLRRSEITRML